MTILRPPKILSKGINITLRGSFANIQVPNSTHVGFSAVANAVGIVPINRTISRMYVLYMLFYFISYYLKLCYGMLISGIRVRSTSSPKTVIMNSPIAILPLGSSAVHFTICSPTSKIDPLLGSHITSISIPLLSVA